MQMSEIPRISKSKGFRKRIGEMSRIAKANWLLKRRIAKANGVTIVNIYYRNSICFCYFFFFPYLH